MNAINSINATNANSPKRSAAVILLREEKPQGLEVFLLKRSEQQKFMAGTYVFPGGIMDKQDNEHKTLARCRGISPAKAQEAHGGALSKEDALAFRVTGVRELFEEAGVLFAVRRTGEPVAIEDTPLQQRFDNYRALLLKGKITLAHLAEKENLIYTIDQFVHFAHWITPEGQPLRFYTHFFIAAMPESQKARADGKEATEGRWISPRNALEENLRGAMILMPPTIASLENLARFATIGDVLHSLKDRETTRAVQPVYVDLPGQPFVVFPWDPDFKQYKKGNIPGNIDHGRPSSPADTSTRILYRKGLSVPYCKNREEYKPAHG
jgi:8-oxo-dGTP pyrophosphatase MutT (NUDIX family)